MESKEPKYTIKALYFHWSTLERQVTEAVLIGRTKCDNILNS